jgi:hypothetical protein
VAGLADLPPIYFSANNADTYWSNDCGNSGNPVAESPLDVLAGKSGNECTPQVCRSTGLDLQEGGVDTERSEVTSIEKSIEELFVSPLNVASPSAEGPTSDRTTAKKKKSSLCEIEQNFMGEQVKMITAYYGNLIDKGLLKRGEQRQ